MPNDLREAHRKSLLLVALGWMICSSATAAARDGACPTMPAAALTELPYGRFDTAPGQASWRTLLNRGCIDMAVATLDAYRAANQARMTPEQRSELSFHIGQTLAFATREKESIPHFEAAINPTSTPEWVAYVNATIGFVRKDRARLDAALAHYEKLAPGSMRLAIIRGLAACFDRPNTEAAHCAM